MALGRITRENNFVYINGETIYDIQSVDATLSVNNTDLNVAGHGAIGFVNEGVLQGEISLNRLAVSTDPFTGLFSSPFSGVWRYIDSDETQRYFAIESGYISNYSFSAETKSIPTISTNIQSYGNMIGGNLIPTGSITTDLNGFLDNYVAPKGINLNFTDGETNRVQSFNFSIDVERTERPRLGQMYSIPQTIVSYPIQSSLEINIDVDEYSAPRIDELICRSTEDISLELKNCEGEVIRAFIFESGSLESVNVSADSENNSRNQATLRYRKNINDVNEVYQMFSGAS